MSESRSPTLFHETLRGVPTWLGSPLVAAGVIGGVAILLSSREHFADPLFWLAALPGLAAAVIAPLAIAMWRLETVVYPGVLAVRLRPLTKREIPLSDVESCEPRRYHAFREYLGWGVCQGPAGRALTVPGHEGVQLTMRGGERLLISSAQSKKLADAIRSAQHA